jgi:hypothetical protein
VQKGIFFLFDHYLEARAEKCKKLHTLTFWSMGRKPKSPFEIQSREDFKR